MAAKRQVLVCQYVNCQRSRSAEVLAAFQACAISDVSIEACGCQGQCNMGPTVRVLPDDTWYCRVKPDDVSDIVEQHLVQDKPVERLLHPRLHPKYYGYGG